MKFFKDAMFNFTVEQTDKFTWFINFVTSHQSWSPTHCDIWIPPLFQSAHQTNPDISSESSLEKAIYTFIFPTERVFISKTLSPTFPRFKRQQRVCWQLRPCVGSIVANCLLQHVRVCPRIIQMTPREAELFSWGRSRCSKVEVTA